MLAWFVSWDMSWETTTYRKNPHVRLDMFATTTTIRDAAGYASKSDPHETT